MSSTSQRIQICVTRKLIMRTGCQIQELSIAISQQKEPRLFHVSNSVIELLLESLKRARHVFKRSSIWANGMLDMPCGTPTHDLYLNRVICVAVCVFEMSQGYQWWLLHRPSGQLFFLNAYMNVMPGLHPARPTSDVEVAAAPWVIAWLAFFSRIEIARHMFFSQ